MRRTLSSLVSVLLIAAAATVAPLAATPSIAGADPVGGCLGGTTQGIGLLNSVSLDGTALTATANPNVFSDGTNYYGVTLCNDTVNHAYSFSIMATVADGSVYYDLDPALNTHSFSLTFTPTNGDTPLIAQLKVLAPADATGFVVNPANGNQVTVTAVPLGFSDIWGSCVGDSVACCPSGTPAQCAATTTTASHDHLANWSGAVRYRSSDPNPATNGGAGFSDLPGLALSSGAYYFDLGASCPTDPNRNQAFSGLSIDVGGPHQRADSSPNTTTLQAFIPAAAVASCFGVTPSVFASVAQLSRQENGTSTPLVASGSATDSTSAGLIYNLSASDAGVVITVPTVTFSKPTYRFGTRSVLRSTHTVAALAASAHVVKPVRGSLRVAIASTSTRVCVATAAKVFAFGKGTCRYTVLARNQAGTITRRVAGSFTQR